MATKTKTDEELLKEMMDMLSPEEREKLAGLTGQGNGGGGTKTPVVKVNYQEIADSKGIEIPKGNFVLGQKSDTIDGKEVLTSAGTDLGKELSAVILKVGNQFSYWSPNVKLRCSSQIITERSEVPVGFNLKNVCNDKSCPRRKEGCAKDDHCINQFIVYLRMPAGTKMPDGSDCPVAMMYIKGTSYMPFKEYMDNGLKGIPSIAVSTKFSVSKDKKGSTVFFVLGIEKGAPVPTAVFKENFDLVSGVNKQLLEYKAESQKKLAEATTVQTGGGSSLQSDAVDASDIQW
jgi:hypothetical protein